ncbi:MAG: TatD family deoxyribonuclease [Planctomycetota bacterium]|nr:MAG: TatD family deoxyribonuclease [Planctomycetota bacterium]
MLTDTHAHVFWDSFDADREAMLARAREAGVTRMIVVGTEVRSSEAAFELCRGRAGLHPTAGIHPHDATASDAVARARVRELCARAECVGVGETGLDYFKEFSPREAQRASFAWHVALARELDKPLVVHCRDAHADTLQLLREHGARRGVMHCYSLGAEELPGYLELGFHISFSGVLTYPKTERLKAAARAVPEDRLLVETDCPYLAPQDRRGKRNEPAFVRSVVHELARLRGGTFEAIAAATTRNASALFGLPAEPA